MPETRICDVRRVRSRRGSGENGASQLTLLTDASAHPLLVAGRLMLANGAETDNVQLLVERLGRRLGYEDVRCTVSYEFLMLTLSDGTHYRTRIGRHVAGFGVNMAMVMAVKALVTESDDAALTARLGELERGHASVEWSPMLVVMLVGLTAACLSRLFGGDWPAFFVCWVSGAVGMGLRIFLGRRHANPYVIPFAAALLSGILGGLSSTLSKTPSMCLVAPAMVIVPGVPLVNAILDLVKNHVTLGVSRIVQGTLALIGISLGLVVATVLTHAVVPVDMVITTPSLGEVVLLAALSALGYAALFNVPRTVVWGCIACGCASFTTRVVLVGQGVELPLATLLAALVVGVMSLLMGEAWRVSPAMFAYPGVVAMVPGSYAFRATVGLLQWAHQGAAVPMPLMAETASLCLNVALLTGAIAVGLALPMLIGWRPPAE